VEKGVTLNHGVHQQTLVFAGFVVRGDSTLGKTLKDSI
jgi:hypothetical protein